MMGDNNDIAEVDGDEDFEDFEDTTEMEAAGESTGTSNVGDPSVELDVEEIIAELEADMGMQPSQQNANPRKRLEELLEERRAARELEELDEFATDKY
ncbi:MAG: hypothetical protein ACE5G3_12065 [Gammaproteobacteria bacterium]